MRDWFVWRNVSISTTPRSDSRAVSMVLIFSRSAFLRSSSLVMLETSRWAFTACSEWARPKASTIWLFHRGMVFTKVDWILSAISLSLFCTRRIWGLICTLTMRVSSKSWSFFSKLSHIWA